MDTFAMGRDHLEKRDNILPFSSDGMTKIFPLVGANCNVGLLQLLVNDFWGPRCTLQIRETLLQR